MFIDRTPADVQVAFEEAGERKIIFSTFDPDCATLARLKQPRYPVFFLTCAGEKVCRFAARTWVCYTVHDCFKHDRRQSTRPSLSTPKPAMARFCVQSTQIISHGHCSRHSVSCMR